MYVKAVYSGAGYEAPCGVLGLVDIYVFSEAATFKYESYAVHAMAVSYGK